MGLPQPKPPNIRTTTVTTPAAKTFAESAPQPIRDLHELRYVHLILIDYGGKRQHNSPLHKRPPVVRSGENPCRDYYQHGGGYCDCKSVFFVAAYALYAVHKRRRESEGQEPAEHSHDRVVR